jgi:hypothetical protein
MERSKQLAPLAGVVFVAGIVAAIVVGQTPDSTASGSKVVAYYQHHQTAINFAGFALAYAAAAAILYFVSVASYLRRCGADLLATTTVVGGAICAGGLLVGAGLLAAANDSPGKMPADVARTLNIAQNDVFVPILFAGLAVATLSMGVAMLRTKALPKALGIVTVVVGVVAFTGIGSWFAFMATGPLTLVIAGYVYKRLGTPGQITMPDVPTARMATQTTSEKSTT